MTALYEEHLDGEGPVVVAFASGDGKRFEWGKTLRRLNRPHVLFRDPGGVWYSQGVEGIGGRDEVVAYIKGLAPSHAVGLSLGAYGAVYYGHRAGVPRIIGISPATGQGRLAQQDFPPQYQHRTIPPPDFREPVEDLKTLLEGGTESNIHWYYSDGYGTECDFIMAQRTGHGRITLISGGHSHAGLGLVMRNAGIIDRLLTSDHDWKLVTEDRTWP